MTPPNDARHDSPYPGSPTWRDIERLEKRIDRIEREGVAKTLAVMEERQASQGQRLGALESDVAVLEEIVGRARGGVKGISGVMRIAVGAVALGLVVLQIVVSLTILTGG